MEEKKELKRIPLKMSHLEYICLQYWRNTHSYKHTGNINTLAPGHTSTHTKHNPEKHTHTQSDFPSRAGWCLLGVSDDESDKAA